MIMTRIKFIISIFIGMTVYVLVSLIGGQYGVWAYDQLKEEKAKIATNVVTVQRINDELKQELLALETDNAIIASRARNLGYIYENEKVVKISGISDKEQNVYNTGVIVRRSPISFVPERSCKIVGLLCFVLCCFVFLLVDVKTKKKPTVIMDVTNEFI